MSTKRCVGQQRYPFAPIETLVHAADDHELARRLGVEQRSIYRYRHRGLSHATADELAIRLGLTAELVWGPGWLDDAATEGPTVKARMDGRMRALDIPLAAAETD